MSTLPADLLRLGCPMWGLKSWVGELFAPGTPTTAFLKTYSTVFNTVEGNTTFYGIPSEDTVKRWRDDADPGFRFALKFPQKVSHERGLVGAEGDTEFFLNRMEILGPLLGPFFLQLPAHWGPARLRALEHWLKFCPPAFSYAVEVRHRAFFDGGPAHRDLDQLLAAHGVDRVIMDTTPLFSAAPDDEITQIAQGKKPQVPRLDVALGKHPFVRYIAHPNLEANRGPLEFWAQKVAQWLDEGRAPYFFAHHPDDFYAPRIARHFRRRLMRHHPLPDPLPWPAEKAADQLSLL
ncbi:MAG: DUF72 domain-containing protein [Bradymonadia bacterium]